MVLFKSNLLVSELLIVQKRVTIVEAEPVNGILPLELAALMG